MSRLRARCPDCRTFTAVAIGPGYECHSCGREFGAGMVRVPRAWGEGGESMAEAARLPLPYPEAAVVEEETLDEQTLAVAIDLPERPLVLGGCCCSHIGAVEALAARNGRIAVIWIDAHGDLNTVESSPSGNLWATPLRVILESGAVDPQDAILLGARSLDPPEREYIASIGLRTDDGRARRSAGRNGRASTSPSTSMRSSRGRSSPSCPSRAASRSTRSSSSSAGSASGRRSWARASALPRAEPANVEPLTRLALALGL